MQIPDPQALLANDAYVRALARHLVADPGRADDLAQQAWIAALEHTPREEGSLRAWLAAIVRNLARKFARGEARRYARERSTARPEALPSTEEILAREEARRLLVQAVSGLEEPYRSAILLRYFEDLPPREIARRLGVPVATARTRVWRGLERLRARLDGEHGGDRAAWCAALAPLVSLSSGPPAGEAAGAEEPGERGGPGDVGRALEAASSAGLRATGRAKVCAATVLLLGLSVVVWEVTRPTSLPRSEERLALGPAIPPDPPGAEPPSAPPVGSPREVARVAEASVSPAAAPEPYGSLLVRVAWGEDGTPAANFGARVYARGEPDPYFLNMDPGAVTGADGSFRIDRIRAGKVQVELERGTGGYAGETTVEPGKLAELSLVVPPGYEVTGEVVDADGRPVPGAAVWLSSEGQGPMGRVVDAADEDGRFRVRSVRGLHWIGARAPGHAPSPLQPVMAIMGETMKARLVLPGPGGEVEGLVLDPTGRPVADAAVELGAPEYRILTFPDGTTGTPPAPLRLRTASDGRFLARGLPPGTLPVTVRAHPRAIWRGSVEVVPNGKAGREASLVEGATLEGVVREADGKAASGVEVSVGVRLDFASSYAKTGPDGSFRLDGLATGEWTAVLDGGERGQTSRSFAAGPGERLRWEATLSPGAEVVGRLVDETGAPLAGWSITAVPLQPTAEGAAYRPRALTDSTGRFRLRNCRDAAHRLEVRTAKLWILAVAQDDVRPSREERLIRVPARALPTAYIKGTVVGPDGRPVGGASVRPTSPEFHSPHTLTTEEGTGRFEVGPLPPGMWVLGIRVPGQPEYRTEPRRLAEGETWDLGVVRGE